MTTKSEMLVALDSLAAYLDAVSAAQKNRASWDERNPRPRSNPPLPSDPRPPLPSSIERPVGVQTNDGYSAMNDGSVARLARNWLVAIDDDSSPSLSDLRHYLAPQRGETDIPAMRFARWAAGAYNLTTA